MAIICVVLLIKCEFCSCLFFQLYLPFAPFDLIFRSNVCVDDRVFLLLFAIQKIKNNMHAEHKIITEEIKIPTMLQTSAVDKGEDVAFSVVAVSSSSAPILCAAAHLLFKQNAPETQSLDSQHDALIALGAQYPEESQTPDKHGVKEQRCPGLGKHIPLVPTQHCPGGQTVRQIGSVQMLDSQVDSGLAQSSILQHALPSLLREHKPSTHVPETQSVLN
jgi:hypothetical protein